jgi:hypothetical protein
MEIKSEYEVSTQPNGVPPNIFEVTNSIEKIDVYPLKRLMLTNKEQPNSVNRLVTLLFYGLDYG